MRKTGAIVLLLLFTIFISLYVQAQDFGTNWTGTFYNNRNFQDPVVATITGINGLNFNWPGEPNINGATVAGVQ
ncbi:MAG: hypothetical protein K8L99_34295, partial [Anaerolineae bacterium]|nr:hypothetical protein [Anaerolineae bacterium]